MIANAQSETEPDESDSIIELTLKLEEARLQLQKLNEELLTPQTVPDKIVYWAKHFGADTSVSLNIACAESRFVAHAKNPNSSAAGVYQWIDSSWARMSTKYYGYVEDKMNEDRNIELSNWVIATYGTSDWNASKHVWSLRPYENGRCQ